MKWDHDRVIGLTRDCFVSLFLLMNIGQNDCVGNCNTPQNRLLLTLEFCLIKNVLHEPVCSKLVESLEEFRLVFFYLSNLIAVYSINASGSVIKICQLSRTYVCSETIRFTINYRNMVYLLAGVFRPGVLSLYSLFQQVTEKFKQESVNRHPLYTTKFSELAKDVTAFSELQRLQVTIRLSLVYALWKTKTIPPPGFIPKELVVQGCDLL